MSSINQDWSQNLNNPMAGNPSFGSTIGGTPATNYLNGHQNGGTPTNGIRGFTPFDPNGQQFSPTQNPQPVNPVNIGQPPVPTALNGVVNNPANGSFGALMGALNSKK